MNDSEKSQECSSYLGKELSELLLLSVLSSGESYSAYKIIQKIKEKSQGVISFRAGTIYPQMVKLEKKGLLSKRIEDITSHAEGVVRQKAVYSITNQAYEVLYQRQKAWITLQKTINQILQEMIRG